MTNEVMIIESVNNGLTKFNLFDNNLVNRFIRFAGVTEKSAKTYITALGRCSNILKAIISPLQLVKILRIGVMN